MSIPIGRFEADEALRRFEAALRERHDPLRPIGRYKVVDNSDWTDVGPSFVTCLVNGAAKRFCLDDSARPEIGSYLQGYKTGKAITAPWLAFPLPQPVPAATCGGAVLVSAQNLTTLAWDILAGHLASGDWTRLSASPVAGAYARRPLRATGSRLWTWGVQESGGAVGAGGPLYRSDDGGATWTASGLTGVRDLRPDSNDSGELYAVTGDGAALAWSGDNGTTWDALAATPPGGGTWLAAHAGGGGGTAYGLATSGLYVSSFFLLSAVVGPYTPASAGWGVVAGAVGGDFSGYWMQSTGGDGFARAGDAAYQSATNPGGAALPAGDALPGGPRRTRGQGPGDWFATDGDGGVVAQIDAAAAGAATTAGAALAYLGSANHPSGATTGVRAAAQVWAGGGACWVVALDTDAASAPRFLVGGHAETRYATPAERGRFSRLDLAQATDLGADYAASQDGLATFDSWYAPPPPAPTDPYSVYSAPGGARTPGIGDDTAITTAAGAGWEAVGYDDTAWSAPVAVPGPAPDGGAQKIGPGVPDAPVYVRRTFTPPSGATTCTLTLWTEGGGLSASLNGTALGSTGSDTIWTVDASALLLPGAANVLAIQADGPPVDYVGFGTSLGVGVAFVIEGS